MPKRKKQPEEPENVERWMLTYLDMITLLMAFFCILFAFAQVDAVKFKQVAQSMKIAMGSGGGGQNAIANFSGTGLSSMSEGALLRLRENSEYQAMIKLLREYAAKKGLSNKIKTKITERGLNVSYMDSVLFESGSAELSPKAREILDATGSILLTNNNVVRVEGHTDNVPIHTARYESNWQLSTDRATSVIMYWAKKYPEKQKYLSAGGYGEFQPLTPDSNNTPEGRANNRRIEIILLRTTRN